MGKPLHSNLLRIAQYHHLATRMLDVGTDSGTFVWLQHHLTLHSYIQDFVWTYLNHLSIKIN